MVTQLVPSDVLKKADKILFIAHLALGDFTYLQNCFQSFAEAYPHIKIHIWIDEVRRTNRPESWVFLKKYALYDWVAACPFVTKLYNQTYSPPLFQQSIKEAQQEAYPVVVSLSTLRPPMYASLAREISPQGFVVGMKKSASLFAVHKHLAYRKLDAALNPDEASAPGLHISDIYAGWFKRLFGIDTSASSRLPFVQIPERWTDYAKQQLRDWGFVRESGQTEIEPKLVFINPYAKTKKRCWPLERVVELALAIRAQDSWRNTDLVVNVVPEEMSAAKAFFAQQKLERFQLFSAQENFFQLPAILQECDLIISVETAVMHLANAVHVPVIALMRQKNPEWAPVDKANSIVVNAPNRRDWVRAITVDQVIAVLPPNT
ncbi:glycosyltransferase family 9 protein [Glaciimonas sp. Gout2]|uniref:glycosyltransferase family 9 protein n=1 Tax=unclassified Glaciimonas TaxID=2644401 RepID=UPI002B2351DD|nr:MULTISPECIES: glycosyltransferase family 9 protein [unclassified Glaciimonas]MEB0012385.1 glycosyltransferase family 9 protein [Glaciimonas sp. Cout2]MEB0080423.1 glycosyltransferase family 9 protein [Glaciimonas sp. Gout2]